jgi:hypothetical protein
MPRLNVSTSALSVVLTTAILASTSFGQTYDVDKISKTNLRHHLEFVAHDLMEGRDTPSRGLDITALYIATQLKLIGVEPGGVNGTYFQPFVLSRTMMAEGATLKIDGKELELAKDFIPSTLANVDAQTKAVYVGGGWTNIEAGVNPLSGHEVKGNIVIVDSTLPEGKTLRDLRRDPKWESPSQVAQRLGAAAVITIADSADQEFWKRQVDRLKAGGQYTPQYDSTPAPAPLANLTVSPEVGELLRSASLSAAREEISGPAPTIALKLGVIQQQARTQNVIGIIPGSDAKLSREYVALGAHYDHVGIGRPDATGDTIFNGADDDGSGTVAMIEIARVIASGQRPKRSTVFVWHSGEEKGLWGSRFFARNPTVDLKNMIIQINMDMISMSKKPGDNTPANAELSGPDAIYVIGPKLISTDITRTLSEVNQRSTKMQLLDKYDSLEDRNQFYQRSDHYSYIERGVPAIFLFSGVHQHYHQQSDEIEVVDFDKLTLTTKLLYGLTMAFGSQEARPRVDGPLKSLFGGQ